MIRAESGPDLTPKLHCHAARMLIVLLAACSSDTAIPLPTDSQVRFVVTNDLVAPVTIAIDGSPYAILTRGRSTGLSVSRSAQLTWTSAKPADAQGQRIPDQIGEVKVAAGGISGVLEITNVIEDQTYITASIVNRTTTAVSIGVFDGMTVFCAGHLPRATSGASGFVQIGYYRLLSATEIRAYRDASTCSGPFGYWTGDDIRAYEAKSGLITLVMDVAP